jgi:plasmid stability protein
MRSILIRGLDPETIERLKLRARRSGRTLQGEAKRVLEQAAGVGLPEFRKWSRRWRSRLAGRKLAGSLALLREDRGR